MLAIACGGLFVAGRSATPSTLVQEFCALHVTEVRCAVGYQKPRSLVECEYVWRRTDRRIDFPWSVDPPVTGKSGRDA